MSIIRIVIGELVSDCGLNSDQKFVIFKIYMILVAYLFRLSKGKLPM